MHHEPATTSRIPFVPPGMEDYWRGGVDGNLLLQRCDIDGSYRHPASELCPVCLSPESSWARATGHGIVYSFAVVHQAMTDNGPDPPYCVAIIELDEGPHVLANITDIALESIVVGLEVQVSFHRLSDDMAIPQFRPVH